MSGRIPTYSLDFDNGFHSFRKARTSGSANIRRRLKVVNTFPCMISDRWCCFVRRRLLGAMP